MNVFEEVCIKNNYFLRVNKCNNLQRVVNDVLKNKNYYYI